MDLSSSKGATLPNKQPL